MKLKKIIPALMLCLLCSCSTQPQEALDIRDDNTARLAFIDKNNTEKSENSLLTLSMRKPITLNPLMNEDRTVDRALKLIFEPLFNISEDQSVIPNLGESYSLSADGLSMTIKLKSGLKWQDGEPVTARDISYSLDTIRRAPETSLYKYCITNIGSYYAADELTIMINYTSPYSACSYNLAFPVIPYHYYSSGEDKSFKPLGSGPYNLSDYNSKEYNLTSAPGVNGTPAIEKVKILITPDEDTDFYSFSQGITDVLDTDSSKWFSYFSDNNCNKAVYGTNCFEYFGFNNNKELFKNQAVRQAIAYCIDREQILSGIYMNNLESSLTPVNPTAYMSSEKSTAKYDYSPDEALKTLWNAGLSPYNYSFSILVNSDNAERTEAAEIIADSLNNIGMKVTVVKKSFQDYISLIQSDEFDTFIGGVNMRCGFDLRPLLLSSAVYSGTNYVNFSDARMDTLLNAEVSAIGETAQKLCLGEVERYISIQLPLIGIGFRNGVVLSDADLTGVTIPYISNCFVNAAKWSYN